MARKKSKTKTAKSFKTKKAKKVARKTATKRAPVRKARKAALKKAPAASPAKRAAKKVTKKAARKTKDVVGEGNYTASRNFRKTEEAFVKKNRKKIPALAKAAETALEGPEGAALEAAEAETRAHGEGME